MTAPLTAVQLYLSASDVQRAELVCDYRERRSASLVWSSVEALADARLDVAVRHAVPEPVVVAEIAVRHRALIGRVDGFSPTEYAEMVASVRSVLGEVHPDDAADLAAFDLWQGQDRWTGEPAAASQPILARAADALVMLRTTAAAAL